VANGINKVVANDVTFNDVIAKLRKGGLNQEADNLVSKQNPITNLLSPLSDSKQAGMSPLVILALAGAGIYFFTRKK
jgi:hypothetical protein